MPRFDVVGMVVSDLPKAVDFYQRLGLQFPEELDPMGHGHVEAPLPGGLRFALDTEDSVRSFDAAWSPPTKGHRITIAFRCESPEEVDRLYQELTGAGASGYKEPWNAFWGQRYAQVRDPDGNVVDLFASCFGRRQTFQLDGLPPVLWCLVRALVREGGFGCHAGTHRRFVVMKSNPRCWSPPDGSEHKHVLKKNINNDGQVKNPDSTEIKGGSECPDDREKSRLGLSLGFGRRFDPGWRHCLGGSPVSCPVNCGVGGPTHSSKETDLLGLAALRGEFAG